MTIVTINETVLDAIGDAIRDKLDVETEYKPSQMAAAIDDIEIPKLEERTFNANGTYTPSYGKNGISQAVVAVPNSYSAADEGKVVANRELVEQTSTTVTENGTYDTTTNDEVVVNVSGGGGSVNILSGADEPSASVGSNGAIYLQHYNYEQITDVSGFTKLYDSSIPFGNNGSKVATRLDETDESELNTMMSKGWNTSGAAYYDSENKIGALGGYDFGEPTNIATVKLWLGRYSAQNKTLIATLQTKDSEGTWNDITDFQISSALPYPLNVFEATVSDDVYGIRWIHKETPNKSSGNNIIFFGMTMYEITEGDDIQKAYLKVNGAWQNLIGSDIDDVNTGA